MHGSHLCGFDDKVKKSCCKFIKINNVNIHSMYYIHNFALEYDMYTKRWINQLKFFDANKINLQMNEKKKSQNPEHRNVQ